MPLRCAFCATVWAGSPLAGWGPALLLKRVIRGYRPLSVRLPVIGAELLRQLPQGDRSPGRAGKGEAAQLIALGGPGRRCAALIAAGPTSCASCGLLCLFARLASVVHGVSRAGLIGGAGIFQRCRRSRRAGAAAAGDRGRAAAAAPAGRQIAGPGW